MIKTGDFGARTPEIIGDLGRGPPAADAVGAAPLTLDGAAAVPTLADDDAAAAAEDDTFRWPEAEIGMLLDPAGVVVC